MAKTIRAKRSSKRRPLKTPRKQSLKAMISEEIRKSHDSFFKLNFSQIEVIKDFIDHFFPNELRDYLDKDSLTLDTTDYITKALRAFYSDIVWRINLMGKPIILALLFEHKSKPEKYIHFQLDDYIKSIQKRDIRNDKPLTLVLPIVIYHGKEKWPQRSILDNFEGIPKVFHKYISQFEYIFINLSDIPDEIIQKLEAISVLRCVFLALKHGRDSEYIETHFPEFFTFFEENPHLQEILEAMIVYLTQNAELREENIETIITQNISPKIKSKVMTLYEQLILKGAKEGREVGIEEGKEIGKEIGNAGGQYEKAVQVVTKGWQRRLSIDILTYLSGLSESEVLRIVAEIEKEKK